MDFIKVDLLFYEGKYDEAILLANELLELPQPSLPTKPRTSLVVRIAQSHEKLCQYEKAYHVLADLFENKELNIESAVAGLNAINFSRVLIRCYYHSGKYEKGILQAYALHPTGKYLDNINEYAAYCYRELHRWDEALAVMRKAIRYVEPWNPEMTKKYKDLHDKLLKEREKLHEDDLKPE
jgi:tetratricopeptide (TPR) repeat protein